MKISGTWWNGSNLLDAGPATLTTEHAASSYGLPVVVREDGTAIDPEAGEGGNFEADPGQDRAESRTAYRIACRSGNWTYGVKREDAPLDHPAIAKEIYESLGHNAVWDALRATEPGRAAQMLGAALDARVPGGLVHLSEPDRAKIEEALDALLDAEAD